MALEQTLATAAAASASAKQFLCFPPTNRSTNARNPIFFSCSLKSKAQQHRPLRLRCSMDYNEHGYNQTVYPKPIEIPWKKELCNSVQLIGNVGASIEIKHLSSGKAVAWTRLAVRKSPTETSWINLTFWDELAHVAFEHVQKGHRIYVSGRLVSDTVERDDGTQQTYYKVVVQQLNFIEKTISPDGDYNNMTTGRMPSNGSANNQKSTEELWQAFFANPVEWWDNRKDKRSPNYPDFKHKDTGEALWIEGKYNPPWVKSQLGILDSRMESLQDQDSRKNDFLQF